MAKAKRDFLGVVDLSEKEFWQILRLAKKLKKGMKTKSGRNRQQKLLAGQTLAMIFEKPSLRTRLSFEAGMTQLGGHSIYLGPADIGLGKREAVSDIATVTSSMVDIIMARTFKHKHVEELAEHSSVPVINALTDLEHPCQILADLMTVWEVKGKLKGLKLAYVGDCDNNVTHSLAIGCALTGMDFAAAGPRGYALAKSVERKANKLAKNTLVKQVVKPQDAVKGADVVVTDTWVSMGDEAEKKKRLRLFKPYQVTKRLMKQAKRGAVFMHCLPAYRGSEVSSGVIDGKQSVVFQEAENRLHVQKGLMLWLLGVKG